MKLLNLSTRSYKDGTFMTFGLDQIRKHLTDEDRFEGHILDMYKDLIKEGDNIIDCGAYIGIHTITMGRLVGNSGRVFSFEPHRIYHQLLNTNIILNGLPNVITQNIGLGEVKGQKRITDRDIFSSTLTHYSGCRIKNDIEQEGLIIKIDTIDNLNLPKISVIKIDVEGYELMVIQGGRNTIIRDKPFIIFEYNRQTKHFNYTWDKLDKYIKNLGYVIKKIDKDNFLASPKR